MRAVKFIIALIMIMAAEVCYAESCPISVAVDLDKEITTKGRPFKEIKDKINDLIRIYNKDVCLYIVGGSIFEHAFIRLNFDVKKTQLRFIDGKDKNKKK